MDGERLEFEAGFDAVFSNAALHWMRQPDAVIAGVWRALRPGGRFVAEMGGDGCVAKIRAALVAGLARRGIDAEALNPWYFPTVDDYCARLRGGGFSVHWAALIARPTELPGDISGWLATFAQSFTSSLAPAERPRFIAEVQAALAPQLCDGQGSWWADYVRLRFSAGKES
jgi:SAM-dependent methyltransferase